MKNSTAPLRRLLEPVGECLTLKTARALVKLRAAPEVQECMAKLARKCNEGKLSAKERAEYEAGVMASNFIAILKSQTRQRLAAVGKTL